MADFPKELSRVFVTSDGEFFETLEQAQDHENRHKLKFAVLQAAAAARFHDYGTFSASSMVDAEGAYLQNLADELIKAGLIFK